MHYGKDFGIDVRIARFHNIYGPYGTWKGGREKAPAAFCRKVSRCIGTLQASKAFKLNLVEVAGSCTVSKTCEEPMRIWETKSSMRSLDNRGLYKQPLHRS